MKAQDRDIEIREKIIGTFLREHRIKSGLTQGDVAKLLKYTTPQFVSNWERGVSQPPMDVLPQLSQRYGIDPDEFVRVFSLYQEEMLKQFRKDLLAVFK